VTLNRNTITGVGYLSKLLGSGGQSMNAQLLPNLWSILIGESELFLIASLFNTP